MAHNIDLLTLHDIAIAKAVPIPIPALTVELPLLIFLLPFKVNQFQHPHYTTYVY